MPREHDRRIEDFAIGDSVAFVRCFGMSDFKAFAKLSRDLNPLHHDRDYAAASQFGEPIIPLHLVAAPLSAIAGMMLPGHRSLYLTSRLEALAPAHYERDITYSARIVDKSEARSTLGLRVIAFDGSELLLRAELVVQVRDDVPAELAPAAEVPPIQRTTTPTAVISGATGAIGSAIALALADSGWNLLLLHRGRQGAANPLKQACAAAGAKVSLLSGDLTEPRALGRLCGRLSKQDGVTALVHTASAGLDAPLDDLMAVNHAALARMSEALLPGMLRRQEGCILLLGSSALQHNPPGWENYTAAKAAASQYVSALNQRYADSGVVGRVLAPGYVDTPFSRGQRPNDARTLLPEQVAEAVVSCLRDLTPRGASYLWLEAGRMRRGSFGFHEGIAAGPRTSALQAKPSSDATPAAQPPATPQRVNGMRDAEALIRGFLGAGGDADLSEAGVDQFPGWDSLRHLELLLHLERELGIAFTSREMEETTRFSELCALAARKQAQL